MADYGSGTMGTIDHILGSRDEVFKPGPTSDQDKIGNQEYYFQIDENTKKIEVKRKWTNVGGQVFDTTVGHYDKDGKYTCKGGSSGGHHQAECEYFTSKEGSQATIKQAKIVAEKDLRENGSTRTRGKPVSADKAQQETKEIIPSNTGEDEDFETQDTAQISEINPGTRKQFPTLQYPVTLDPKRQDTIHFSMLEYSPKKLTASNSLLGSGSRGKDRKSIGSVTLPIPNGIKDADKVEWGDDSMNAGELALASIAFKTIGEGTTGANAEMTKIRAGLEGIGGKNAKEGIASHFTGAAIGKDKGKFMSRATGQVMNPNMELLFTGPSLRDFSFTFLLAPRDHKEAKEVIKIIRFFKQGMLPIRSKSNLFLKAPHTFQLKYQTKGENHPYLNSFKECALKSCDVNYTPENSYSTYTDSVMTAYSITLAFSELEPIYNDDYGSGGELPSHLNFESEGSSKTPGTTDYNPDSGYTPGYGPKDDEGISEITGKPKDTSKGGSFI